MKCSSESQSPRTESQTRRAQSFYSFYIGLGMTLGVILLLTTVILLISHYNSGHGGQGVGRGFWEGHPWEFCDYDLINFPDLSPLPLNSSPLLLSPYIKNGSVEEGRKRSFVGDWKGIQSYSGFLTVNERLGSNLFFWFFPHRGDGGHENTPNPKSDSVPLILHLQGGPGVSSMFGLFLENGPFVLDPENNRVKLREFAWTKTHSVLYIDNPVGTGFSFATNPDALAKDQEDVARDLYEALTQFFMLFPEYQKVDFYLAGTSYAGKYVPTLAHLIHQKNEEERVFHQGQKDDLSDLDPSATPTPSSSSLLIKNLRGILIGSGYFDYTQDEYSDYLYNLGLLDEEERDLFKVAEETMKGHVRDKEYKKPRQIVGELIINRLGTASGFSDIFLYNALRLQTPLTLLNFGFFLNQTCVKSSLHVGQGQSPELNDWTVYSNFRDEDFYFSPKPYLETLLNSSKYSVLIYSAQLDIIITHLGVSRFVNSLSWTRSSEFSKVKRRIWRVNGTVAGYARELGNLTYLLIREAGHVTCYDQPGWCFDMINRFTRGQSFSNNN